ncbi:MAG TPA: hypothetical protein VF439_03610 [Candidatus Paceibacterota bacterium]
MPKANRTVPIERLEQQFQVWEELMWAYGTHCVIEASSDQTTFVPYNGPAIHYSEFRRHLLEIKSVAELDMGRFTFHSFTDEQQKNFVAWPTLFMFSVASWTTNSRRVFHVSLDLQAVLGATSLGRLKVRDVPWPFSAFCISLEEPVSVSMQSPRATDLLLITAKPDEEDWRRKPTSYVMCAMNHRLRSWNPYGRRASIERLIASGKNAEAAQRLLKDDVAARDLLLMPFGGIVNMDSDETVEELLSRQAKGVQYLWRIVFGLAVYLRGKQDVAAHVSPWTKVAAIRSEARHGESPKKGIADASQVCHVSSLYTLSDKEREQFLSLGQCRSGGYEMPFHFRIAHSRAAWGERKANPEAEKTVSIKSTHVRLDRKPDVGVAGGAKVIL